MLAKGEILIFYREAGERKKWPLTSMGQKKKI